MQSRHERKLAIRVLEGDEYRAASSECLEIFPSKEDEERADVKRQWRIISPVTLARLRAVSSCDVSDALQRLGLPQNFMSDILLFSPAFCDGPTKIIGPAHTVRFVQMTDDKAPKVSPTYAHWDTAPRGSIIVAEVPKSPAGMWGNLMTTGVMKRGVSGLVTNGRVRDVPIIREMGFPMFAAGISVSGTQKHVRPSELNIPVKIADVEVAPGDIIFGDANGVVSIPLKLVDQVMEEVEKGQVLDARCLAELEAGTSIRETFEKHRKWGFTTLAK